MRHLFRSLPARLALALLLLVAPTLAATALAQVPTLVTATTPAVNIVPIPISATSAVNNQTTLTIPAPAGGLSNYVCYLAYEISQDATSTAYSVAVSTSTNFNSFAVKVSQPATVNVDSGVQVVLNSNGPTGGCSKSTIPGTATTFVGPVANLHAPWTWYATYFQAP